MMIKNTKYFGKVARINIPEELLFEENPMMDELLSQLRIVKVEYDQLRRLYTYYAYGEKFKRCVLMPDDDIPTFGLRYVKESNSIVPYRL